MPKMNCKTRGNASPRDKRKVYFTCHPDDFEHCFSRISEDILATHDCAVYYTEDMSEPFTEDELDTDIGSVNLIVVPVTFNLLSKPCRAMSTDIAYAKSKRIPLLPFMMESGLTELYSSPEHFGERQYIEPYCEDTTAISYGEKLKKYLGSILISDETANRVREAFDAYIFLSYRKKDRKFANDLMRLIHSNPKYRDIAVWYDEFLTPGESFKDNIDRILSRSKLFTLLVTPSLLDTPNFVADNEYPAAKEAGLPILPTEMKNTDRDELLRKYRDIPECRDPYCGDFFEHFGRALCILADEKNDSDPEHKLLIGLAYLDGIDVEVNREYGLELITSAAESGLAEAMRKLYEMYAHGEYVDLDHSEALKWIMRLTEHCIKEYGKDDERTLWALHNLGYEYSNIGDHQRATDILEEVYALRCRVIGEEHPDTLQTLNNLAYEYSEMFEDEKALEAHERAYLIYCRTMGEDHPDTLRSLSNLAYAYGESGEYERSLELSQKVYLLKRSIMGDGHPSTFISLNNLASAYSMLGHHESAKELYSELYFKRRELFGEEHTDILAALECLIYEYKLLGQTDMALELGEKLYFLSVRIFGEGHPDTWDKLSTLAYQYGEAGDHEESARIYNRLYLFKCRALGEGDPDTLNTLSSIAYQYGEAEEHEKATELYEKLYSQRCSSLGPSHPATLLALSNLGYEYRASGDLSRSVACYEKVYGLRLATLGEEDDATAWALYRLSETCGELGRYREALEGCTRAYEHFLRSQGEGSKKAAQIKAAIDSIKGMMS